MRSSAHRPAWLAVLCCGGFLLAAAALAHGTKGQQTAASAPALHFAHGGNAAEIPMELAGNAVFVPVQCNQGRPSSWLLDSGSPGTVVSGAAASQAITGDDRPSPVLSLPGVGIHGLQPAVHSLQALGPWYGQRVNGVIGDDVLAHLVVELDYARRSIELYEPAAYHEARHFKKLGVHWIDGLPTVRAKLRLAGRAVTGNFVLNTGASGGILVSSAFLEANRMYPFAGKTISGSIVAASGEREVLLARGEWLELGSWQVTQPIVAIEQSRATPAAEENGEERKEQLKGIAGWIGGQILRKFRLVLDFPSRRILLLPNSTFIFPIEANASGATIIAAGPSLDQYEVRRIASGSPAAVARLLPGDRITVIDSEPTSQLTLSQVRRMLSRSGHTVVLGVERLGHHVRIVLHLRRRL